MSSAAPWTWERRSPPLAPGAVLASGSAGLRLLRVALARRRAGAALRIDLHDDAVVLRPEHLGPDDPPWVDGCQLYGLDPEVPGVWWPTARRPRAPTSWLAAALHTRAHTTGEALLVREDPPEILILSARWPASVEELEAEVSARTPPGVEPGR